MDIGCVDLDSVGEHRLDQLDDRRIGRVDAFREFVDVDLAVAEFPLYLGGKRVDLFLAAVLGVDRADQVGFADQRYLDGFSQ